MVSCKSKRVLPQLGHEIYSVFEIRVRLACNIPKAKEFMDWYEPQFSAAINIPSPKPSNNKAPKSALAESCNCSCVKSP